MFRKMKTEPMQDAPPENLGMMARATRMGSLKVRVGGLIEMELFHDCGGDDECSSRCSSSNLGPFYDDQPRA